MGSLKGELILVAFRNGKLAEWMVWEEKLLLVETTLVAVQHEKLKNKPKKFIPQEMKFNEPLVSQNSKASRKQSNTLKTDTVSTRPRIDSSSDGRGLSIKNRFSYVSKMWWQQICSTDESNKQEFVTSVERGATLKKFAVAE